MQSYKYQARDREGNAHTGFMTAADVSELRRHLRTNDLFLTSATGGGKRKPQDLKRTRHKLLGGDKPSALELVITMRQLATMIRSGLPLIQAIEIVGSQTNKECLTVAFADLGSGVGRGEPLSTAMRRHPQVFSTLVLALVEAGETAGTLELTLEVAAKQLDREAVLRQKVLAATLYPKLVVFACVATIFGMMVFVVPTFSNVYAGLHAKLPEATLLLTAVSRVFVRFWWVGALALFGLSKAFKRYGATAAGRRRLDIIGLKLPVLGKIARQVAIARFVQTFEGALRGGIPVLRSLAISANTSGNVVIRDAVISAAENVRDGSSIAVELERTEQFPVMVVRMVGAGEISGNLDEMLSEISKFYERDVETAVEQLTRMIEPAMTVIVGTIVLLILLALYLPVFNLGKVFHSNN